MRGVRLPIEWVEKAEVFLKEARKHFGEGIHRLTCFEAHQASELYLKALLVSLTGLHPYTHDLSELLETAMLSMKKWVRRKPLDTTNKDKLMRINI